LKIAMTS